MVSPADAGQSPLPSGRRKDIEGLRAIAIALVVAAHAAVPGLTGGFVGVDVFFVLSGFLITGILARAADGGNPRLVDFYARRLRRLLPALLLVFVATILAACWLWSPIEQAREGDVALAVPLWVANIVFAFRDVDYFGGTADSSLFLHTWSLGVEEQFYLVWPTLIFLVLGVWRLPGATAGSRRSVRLLLVLALIGLAYSLFRTFSAPISAYYLLPSRFWQFAVGGLIALKYGRGEPMTLRKPVAEWLGWAGLAAILVSAVVLDGKQPYPGYWALLPTLGTAAAVATGLAAPTVLSRLLSIAPLQWLGRLSYSWYLWHWPVLLLGRSLFPEQSLPLSLSLAVLSLALAYATFRLVETPIRYNRWLVQRPKLTVAFSLLLMLTAACAALAWKSVAIRWAAQPGQKQYLRASLEKPVIYRMGCDEWYYSARVRPCVFGPESAPRTAVIIGDSIGLQWFPALAKTFPAPEWKVVVLTKSSCAIIDKPIFYARIGRRYVECERWRYWALSAIADLAPDIVVVGSEASYEPADREWPAAEKRILEVLGSSAKSVVVIAPTPVLGFDGPNCLARKDWRPGVLAGMIACETPLGNSSKDSEYAQLELAASGLANVRVVSFDGLICPDNLCRAKYAGRTIYRDDKHLSVAFVDSLSGPVAGTIRQAAGISASDRNR